MILSGIHVNPYTNYELYGILWTMQQHDIGMLAMACMVQEQSNGYYINI